MDAGFTHRVANAFHGIGLANAPEDSTRGELLDIIRNGRGALRRLESIAFIDFHTIQVYEF